MEQCKPRFPYNGSWCEESRVAFVRHLAEQGTTDCLTNGSKSGMCSCIDEG